MPYDEINLTGMDIDNVDWGGSRLRVSFGHGYGAFATTGNPSGLHHWKISDSGVLPDRAGSDYGPIGSQSRFDYYYEFFKSHTTGAEEIFIIEWRGKKYHACFVDAKQSYQRFTEDLFSGGVDVEQRRVSGFTYETDGSLPVPDTTPPTVPTGLTATVEGDTSILLEWAASSDPDSTGDTTPPTVPTGLTATVEGDSSISLEWEASTDILDSTPPSTPSHPAVEAEFPGALLATWEASSD